jgi:hypothetical protein|tara:strand:+ start:240 stop:473 length:234 start_codon:yes stop_codon:yes gene_type:complete
MYKFFVMLLLILILLVTCNGCTYFVAKETVKVIDDVLEQSPNPEKKKKIIKKQNKIKDKAREFYCSKVKDKEKCNNE